LPPFKELRLAQRHKYPEHVIRAAAVINGISPCKLSKPAALWSLDGTFQSTKTKLNVKLLKVVDDYIAIIGLIMALI